MAFVTSDAVRATGSSEGAVKVAPEPKALFIRSIKGSVNRGFNKAKLLAPRSAPFTLRRTQGEFVPVYMALINPMPGWRIVRLRAWKCDCRRLFTCGATEM